MALTLFAIWISAIALLVTAAVLFVIGHPKLGGFAWVLNVYLLAFGAFELQ